MSKSFSSSSKRRLEIFVSVERSKVRLAKSGDFDPFLNRGHSILLDLGQSSEGSRLYAHKIQKALSLVGEQGWGDLLVE